MKSIECHVQSMRPLWSGYVKHKSLQYATKFHPASTRKTRKAFIVGGLHAAAVATDTKLALRVHFA